MPVTQFDHVNIRTADLGAMLAFYQDILGLTSGERPDFPFGGAWLYCGDRAVVHLVEITERLDTRHPRIEHIAFRADGLAGFLGHLRGNGVAYSIGLLPGSNTRQINFFDPDGNHIHVDFASSEEADLSDFPGRSR
jgi:catechol 2,3-dioxygenase-like lactoylglutathione lyase family enzyme